MADDWFCMKLRVASIFELYIHIYTHDIQIVHHNPCFSLFILHNIPFDNQGSEINKNDISLSFDIISFTKTFSYIYIYIYIFVPNFTGHCMRFGGMTPMVGSRGKDPKVPTISRYLKSENC